MNRRRIAAASLASLLTTLAAAGAPAQPAAPAPADAPPIEPAAEPPPEPAAPRAAPTAPPARPATARDAATALRRAYAAYEYGDMSLVVDSTRPVVDGLVPSTIGERVQALGLMGTGLFLTGRVDGAEAAFFELLRLRPKTRLDPATTNPEVIAFFGEVRGRRAADIREAAESGPHKSLAWNFLPPAGQFQNHDYAWGWTIATLEVVSLGGAIGTKLQLQAWEGPGHTFPGHTDNARTLKTLNYASVALFLTTAVVGVVQGATRFERAPADDAPFTAWLTPQGVALGGRW